MSDNNFDNVSTTDDVFKLAAQRTGLTEIDSDSWRDGLAIMLDELNSSAAFTPSAANGSSPTPPTRSGGACRSTPTSRSTPKSSTRPSSDR